MAVMNDRVPSVIPNHISWGKFMACVICCGYVSSMQHRVIFINKCGDSVPLFG